MEQLETHAMNRSGEIGTEETWLNLPIDETVRYWEFPWVMYLKV